MAPPAFQISNIFLEDLKKISELQKVIPLKTLLKMAIWASGLV